VEERRRKKEEEEWVYRVGGRGGEGGCEKKGEEGLRMGGRSSHSPPSPGSPCPSLLFQPAQNPPISSFPPTLSPPLLPVMKWQSRQYTTQTVQPSDFRKSTKLRNMLRWL
jgi:hypothetical protein